MRARSLLLLGLLAATLLSAPHARADVLGEVQALMARGEWAAALNVAQTAVAKDPRNAQAGFLQGVVLMEMQRNDEALAAFTRFSQAYPELPEPYNNIALIHVRAGRLEPARQALETALRNDPGHRAARANLGEVHLMLAVQAWERTAGTGPLDARLMRRLDAARALVAAGATDAR